MSEISIEEAEKIAIEFVKKKRAQATKIKVNEVTPLDGGMIVSGTYKDPKITALAFDWEVKIGKNKKVSRYKIQ